MIQNAHKLVRDIETVRENWNERSSFTLAGVGNLSCSDLDSLELYAETFIKNGGYGFSPFSKPIGYVAKVLSAYSVEDQNSTSNWW